MINQNESPPGQSEFFFGWQPAAWLRISGADSFSFLQGQFTNDLRGLSKTGAIYGLWLNHKGRVLADSFVLRGGAEEAFWVGSYFCPANVIRERLEAFIIADDVVVEDVTADWSGITVFGEAPEGFPVQAAAGAVSFVGRRSHQPHTEFVFPVAAAAAVADGLVRLGGTELHAAEIEQRRIISGIPAIPRDIGAGELPNEGGLEAAAISYTKGCYLGQEVMARLKSMGQVRRRLLSVMGSGAIPSLPAAIHQGDRRIGELRTAALDGEGFVGLALLSLLHLRIEDGLSFSPGGDVVMKVSPSA